MLKKGLLAVCLTVAVSASLAACGGGNAGNEPAPGGATSEAPPADGGGAGTTVDATAIYEANCMACHAADLSGGGGFPNLQAVGSKYSQEEIANIINTGGNGMPAFQGRLADDEISALAEWLAAKK